MTRLAPGLTFCTGGKYTLKPASCLASP